MQGQQVVPGLQIEHVCRSHSVTQAQQHQQPGLSPGQLLSTQLVTPPVVAALSAQGLVALPRGDGTSVLASQQLVQQAILQPQQQLQARP